MIMINDQWEQVKDTDDVYRIVEQNIGTEFVQKVREIFDMSDQINELQYEIEALNTESNMTHIVIMKILKRLWKN